MNEPVFKRYFEKLGTGKPEFVLNGIASITDDAYAPYLQKASDGVKIPLTINGLHTASNEQQIIDAQHTITQQMQYKTDYFGKWHATPHHERSLLGKLKDRWAYGRDLQTPWPKIAAALEDTLTSHEFGTRVQEHTDRLLKNPEDIAAYVHGFALLNNGAKQLADEAKTYFTGFEELALALGHLDAPLAHYKHAYGQGRSSMQHQTSHLSSVKTHK